MCFRLFTIHRVMDWLNVLTLPLFLNWRNFMIVKPITGMSICHQSCLPTIRGLTRQRDSLLFNCSLVEKLDSLRISLQIITSSIDRQIITVNCRKVSQSSIDSHRIAFVLSRSNTNTIMTINAQILSMRSTITSSRRCMVYGPSLNRDIHWFLKSLSRHNILSIGFERIRLSRSFEFMWMISGLFWTIKQRQHWWISHSLYSFRMVHLRRWSAYSGDSLIFNRAQRSIDHSC